jgi:hypothetical protein
LGLVRAGSVAFCGKRALPYLGGAAEWRVSIERQAAPWPLRLLTAQGAWFDIAVWPERPP